MKDTTKGSRSVIRTSTVHGQPRVARELHEYTYEESGKARRGERSRFGRVLDDFREPQLSSLARLVRLCPSLISVQPLMALLIRTYIGHRGIGRNDRVHKKRDYIT